MNQSDWHRVSWMLVDGATALMRAFGTQVRYDPAGEAAHPPADGVLAVIGFGGRSFRGSLIVSANRGLLERSCPVPCAGNDEQLQDWLGEIANQLLGRLKAQLLAHGIVIELGTPATVAGLELRVRPRNECLTPPLWLVAGSDWLVARLDATAEPNVLLCLSPDPSNSATEGEVLLF
jgi:CheY-specific phosphatase CheX